MNVPGQFIPIARYDRACGSCGDDDPLTVKVKRAPGAMWLCEDCEREENQRRASRASEGK